MECQLLPQSFKLKNFKIYKQTKAQQATYNNVCFPFSAHSKPMTQPHYAFSGQAFTKEICVSTAQHSKHSTAMSVSLFLQINYFYNKALSFHHNQSTKLFVFFFSCKNSKNMLMQFGYSNAIYWSFKSCKIQLQIQNTTPFPNGQAFRKELFTFAMRVEQKTIDNNVCFLFSAS